MIFKSIAVICWSMRARAWSLRKWKAWIHQIWMENPYLEAEEIMEEIIDE